MQAPPRQRPRPDRPPRPRVETVRVPELRPRRVIAPLVPFVLILVMAGFAAALALALLPIFGAAGAGVNAFRERLDAAGIGRAGIPHLPQSSTIYASDGTVLAEIYLDENRRYVRIGKIAPVAQNAVIAIEDDSFYDHGALNFPSLMRAAITNLIAGEIEQGGSTLTQQLVKNVLIDSPEQTFARKFQEAALAIRVERKYSKRKILELYMNEAYYGNGAYGIEVAAQTYFHTRAKDLTLKQAALLAAVIRAPGTYDPVTHRDAARARRNLVIDRMAGRVSKRPRLTVTPGDDRCAVHANEPLRGRQENHRVVAPPAVRVLMRQRLPVPQPAALLERLFDVGIGVEDALPTE